jgi:hypothetical protein
MPVTEPSTPPDVALAVPGVGPTWPLQASSVGSVLADSHAP